MVRGGDRRLRHVFIMKNISFIIFKFVTQASISAVAIISLSSFIFLTTGSDTNLILFNGVQKLVELTGISTLVAASNFLIGGVQLTVTTICLMSYLGLSLSSKTQDEEAISFFIIQWWMYCIGIFSLDLTMRLL